MRTRTVRYTLFISVAFLMVSCGADEEKSASKNDAPPPPPIDTITPIIDSIRPLVTPGIEDYFVKKFEEKTFNGVYLFAQHGQVIHKNAYGFANFKTKDSLTTQSVFQLASASKPFTATAVLMLIDEGLIGLDDNVRDYFYDFPYEGITIRMLLCHRGGLGNYSYFAEKLWPDKKVAITNTDVVDLMVKYNPDVYEDKDVQMVYFRPNIRFDYSNTGYALLAEIVARTSGMKFEDYMKKNIFDKAGMTNTVVYNEKFPVEIANKVNGYLFNYKRPGNQHLNGVVGDKGVYSTIEDILKFDQALNNGQLVSDSLLAIAYTPSSDDRKKKSNSYGLGWRILNNSEDQIIFHTGWWQGFRSYFIRNLTKDQTVVVLDNVKRGQFLGVRKLLSLIDESYKEKEKPVN
jgi:CubicO group peptidase (beta-lactamase class C family)